MGDREGVEGNIQMIDSIESGVPAGFAAGATMIDGPRREVLRLAAAALDLAEQRGLPLERCAALTAMGRAYRAIGAPGAAESMLRQAVGLARCGGAGDLEVEVLCELCEAACLHAIERSAAAENDGDAVEQAYAARERARDTAYEVAALARRTADPHWEASALLRASDVLNRCGDHEDAAQLQQRALALMPSRPVG
jgi:tetratricopeptide (TPR) repeat protein